MNVFNKNKKKFSLNINSSIKDAIKLINQTEERICFVVDNKNKLISSISDGDVRRGILKGVKIDDRITKIHNKKPITFHENYSYESIIKKFNKRISVIPIVDSKGLFLGILRKHDVVPFLDIKSKKILVVGMGYVGLTLALVLADVGFEVKGYDKNKKLIKNIKNKKAPFFEKGMQAYLDSQVGNNCNLIDRLENFNSDVYIITVGTPFDKKKNKPDLSNLKKSIIEISKHLKKNDLIILRSTVPVGCTRNIVAPLLEKNSGLKIGKELFLAFCPERTTEGQAIEELKKLPQIIGGYCKKSLELARRLFNEYTYTLIDTENLESAEFSKLIDNTYRDIVFAYSNQMALLAEKLKLNLPEIIDKVNIGYERNMIPKPSPGVGGPCLSKDPYILQSSFRQHNLEANLTLASRKTNEKMIGHMAERSDKILSKIGKKIQKSKIFISGFAFKGNPETSDMRNSTTLLFLEHLRRKNIKNIWAHDFKVNKEDLKKLKIKTCTIEQGFKEADAVFIMNNHLSYNEMNIFRLINSMKKPALFFDSWQLFEPQEIKNILGITYASVGTN